VCALKVAMSEMSNMQEWISRPKERQRIATQQHASRAEIAQADLLAAHKRDLNRFLERFVAFGVKLEKYQQRRHRQCLNPWAGDGPRAGEQKTTFPQL